MKKLLFLFSIIISICSCSPEIGKWDDNIHLSARTAEFNNSEDSVIIKTKGTTWWIGGISVDSTNYFDFTGINQLADNYSIKQADVLVERRDRNTLFIKADANPLNVGRIIKIWLEAGDYFDSVTITQKAK